MKIVVFGAGQIGKAIAQYFLSQTKLTQLSLIDINHEQLVTCETQLSKHFATTKLQLNSVENSEQCIAEADLVFTAIPWHAHTDIINAIAHYDKATIIISRPLYSELETLKIKLQNMTQPVIVGSGLEPGLTEIMARYCARLFDKLNSLHIKCGGITLKPANNLLGYKALFGTQYLPIAIRHAYTVNNMKLMQVPRFSDVEQITIAEVGQLEAWHDGMVPWLYKYPEINSAHTISQKTLRWPGFATIVQQLHQLGLLSEKEIQIGDFSISPKRFIDHLYADNTKLINEDNVTLLQVIGCGQLKAKSHNIKLMLSATNCPESGLNSLALLTGYTASVIGLLILDKNIKVAGLTYPECVIQAKQFEELISELMTHSIQFDIEKDIVSLCDE